MPFWGNFAPGDLLLGYVRVMHSSVNHELQLTTDNVTIPERIFALRCTYKLVEQYIVDCFRSFSAYAALCETSRGQRRFAQDQSFYVDAEQPIHPGRGTQS